MRRNSTQVVTVALAAVLLLGLAACTTFRSSYFTRSEDKPTTIGPYRLIPRIFAYKESRVSSERARKGLFHITLRAEDTNYVPDPHRWQQSDAEVGRLAEEFFNELTDLFVIDSLVLHETPATRNPLALIPDSTNYSPRRENFLTFKFGEIEFPRETVRLRAVLHIRRAGLPPSADSVVYQLWRVELEERGLLMFKNNAQGY